MDDDDTGTTTTETTSEEAITTELLVSGSLPDADAVLFWAAKIALAMMIIGLGSRIARSFATTGGS